LCQGLMKTELSDILELTINKINHSKVLLTVISNSDCQQNVAKIQFLITRRDQGLVATSFTTSDIHRMGHVMTLQVSLVTSDRILLKGETTDYQVGQFITWSCQTV